MLVLFQSGEPRVSMLGALVCIVFTGACGGSDDDDSKAPRNTNMSLAEACAASCIAQAETNCPDVFPPGQCTDLCISFPERLPACTQAWININACMANAPLFCDRVNGGAAVSSKDCGPEIEAISTCTR